VRCLEIDELFQKLEPILGKRIKALWLEYVLNPDSKQEIEGLLKALAAKHLNHHFEKRQITLVPPERQAALGEYPLGTVYYGRTPLHEFGLREKEWIQHMAIFGRTGSGKTNVGFLVVKNLLEKQKPFLVFDWKRNYRDLIESLGPDKIMVFTVGRDVAPFSFNPLVPPAGTTPTIWLKKLIEIMCHVYWLGEGVAYLLQKAIDSVYQDFGIFSGANRFPTLADVKKWLEEYKAKRREAQWMDSTLRAIATLCYGDIGKVLNSGAVVKIEELLKHNVILELDALTNSDKTFLIESLLLWIHHYRLQEKERETFKHAIIIEEAHHVLLKKKESKETVMDIILREIRELGESIILIDQHPSLISIPSIGNTYCTIAMNLKHARDVNTIGEAMLLNEEQKEYLGKVPVGYGMVKLQNRHAKPFLIRFPFVEVKKGSTTDEEIREYFSGYSSKFGVVPSDFGEREVIQDIQAGDKIESTIKLSEKEKELLEDIVKFPVCGVADRFRRLNITANCGYKVLGGLISSGLVESNFVATPKGRVRFLQLNEKGRQLIGEKGYHVTQNRGGPEHEYWKHKIAEQLEREGYAIELEKQIDSHCVDVIAVRNEEAIAIEIETGKSDADANIRSDLEAGLKVTCFVLSPNLSSRLKRTFAGELEDGVVRLLGPGELANLNE
jgi:DNA helicase HerA-like ATPase